MTAPQAAPRGHEAPRLASGGILVRGDGQMLLTHHALGPFAGRWSMPLVGVADHETAEDALARLMREMLGVEPGPVEFLDTLYLEGEDGDRFVLNAFTCVDWTGEPSLRGGLYDQAVWAPPADAATLDLVAEVRDWIAASTAGVGAPEAPVYDAERIERTIAEARGELIAAYDAVPAATRRAPRAEGWSPVDVLAHAADVEVYSLAEAGRCLREPGREWRPFNDVQWADMHHLRPTEDEATLRARLQTVRGQTVAWLRSASSDALNAYVNHPTRGLVQIGGRIESLAVHDRAHANQLRDMAAQPASSTTGA